LKRNQELSPSADNQTKILAEVTKVISILDALTVLPDEEFEVRIEECRQVGSFKKGTMMDGSMVADVAVILKTLPTKVAVQMLADKIVEKAKAANAQDKMMYDIMPSGFELKTNNVTVNVLIGTTPPNMRKVDPEIHLEQKMLQGTLAAIRHVRWFEENAAHSNIKVLVRILKDMTQRFEGLQALTPWIIELLAHHVVMNTPNREPLPVNQAFLRVFKLLSAGFFLPGAAGIVDPCENANVRVHSVMDLEQQDQVCYTAQTLLRVLAHGGYKKVIGPDGDGSVATKMSVWNGVVVAPCEKAYVKVEKEKEATEEQPMDV
jgi:interleukin enhancer-binding factor 2